MIDLAEAGKNTEKGSDLLLQPWSHVWDYCNKIVAHWCINPVALNLSLDAYSMCPLFVSINCSFLFDCRSSMWLAMPKTTWCLSSTSIEWTWSNRSRETGAASCRDSWREKVSEHDQNISLSEYVCMHWWCLSVILTVVFGSWYEHVRGWWQKKQTTPNILYLFYEDLIEVSDKAGSLLSSRVSPLLIWRMKTENNGRHTKLLISRKWKRFSLDRGWGLNPSQGYMALTRGQVTEIGPLSWGVLS